MAGEEIVDETPVSGLEGTVFVRNGGGQIQQIDVPTLMHARDIFEKQLATGELVLVEGDCVQVPNWDGSGYHWAEVDADDAPKKPRGKKTVDADDTAE